jgi:putative membrane protein
MMWGYYYPGMAWLAILGTLFWLVLIGVVVWALVRWVAHLTRTGGSSTGGPSSPGIPPSAEEILRQRFARGEIDAATYRAMRDELHSGESRPATGPTA